MVSTTPAPLDQSDGGLVNQAEEPTGICGGLTTCQQAGENFQLDFNLPFRKMIYFAVKR